MNIPAGNTALPAGIVPNQFKISGLRLGRRCRRGRIGVVVLAHAAAQGLELSGFRGAFAQQTHHGVERAARVVVGVVGGGLHLGGFVLLLHFQKFLGLGKVAHGLELALQPRNVRGRVEILRRQRRLIVGVLHVAETSSLTMPIFSGSVCIVFFILVVFRLRAFVSQPGEVREEPGLANNQHFLSWNFPGG